MNTQKNISLTTQPQYCYRHPEIKSGAICIGCGKSICPTCIILYRNLIYCATCYAVVEVTNTAIAEQDAKKKKWYYSVPFVLLMLFAVAGPLAFPLLWKSPKFSFTSKIILTIAVTLLTIVLLWVLYKMFLIFMGQYRELMKTISP